MIALIVPKNTEVTVIKDNTEFYGNNLKQHVTTKENMFFAEDIRIDPLGNVGCGPQDESTIGGWYAEHGYYGFARDGWIMLVHARHVEAH